MTWEREIVHALVDNLKKNQQNDYKVILYI